MAGVNEQTFAPRLARLLPGVVVIEVDDFLNWSDLGDWWPRVEDEAIAPLLAGHLPRVVLHGKDQRLILRGGARWVHRFT